MTNRWLQLLETHVEKGLLGLAALFMLFMLWMYMLNSPNTATYNAQELGPRELMDSIKQDADRLDAAVQGAKPKDLEEEHFSEKLRQQFAQGIFGEDQQEGLAVSAQLPRVAAFGRPIVVPGLAESEGAESSGAVVLATPLRPSQPKLRTGRSLVIDAQLRIESEEAAESAAAPPSEQPKSKETAWVTIASYFNKKAQYDEMIKAGYANYRANAYVVSQDVQRQEVLSTGEYSEWEDVAAGKAMPKCDLPEPQFDDETKQLINKDEIRQAFALVKNNQDVLMQPPFYMVEAGDFWMAPPLAGHEDEEDEEDEEIEDDSDRRRGGNVSTGRRSGRTGRAGRSSGRTGRSGRSGRSSGAASGGRSPGAAKSPGDSDREERKQIRDDLKETRKLLGKKEYEEARRLAELIINNRAASEGNKRESRELLKIAERWIDILAAREGGGGRSRSSGIAERIVNPETEEPAVWFHDDNVEAGKTYRYRMRVKLWNRYVGRVRAVKNQEQAQQSIVNGEWSYPSDPITVTPSTYFFLSSCKQPDSASFDVWKWRKGRWLKQRFDISVGDVIGGSERMKTGEYDEEGAEVEAEIDFHTGAVVLDMRFDEPVRDRWPRKDGAFVYRDKDSMVLTYLDPADGRIKERLLLYDSVDPKNKELKDQAW